MGILNDIAMGKRDFINGDVENISDPRNWPYPKSIDTHSKPAEEEKESTETEQEDVESQSSEDEV